MAQDDLFKALADANRRKILKLLGKKDSMTAGDIADQFSISKPAISDHLKILRNAGLIYADKQGQFIYYQLNATVMQEMAVLLFDLLKINKNETGSRPSTGRQGEKETGLGKKQHGSLPTQGRRKEKETGSRPSTGLQEEEK